MRTQISAILILTFVLGVNTVADDTHQVMSGSYGFVDVVDDGGCVLLAKLNAIDHHRSTMNVEIQHIFGAAADRISVGCDLTEASPSEQGSDHASMSTIATIGEEITLCTPSATRWSQPHATSVVNRMYGSVSQAEFNVGDTLLLVCLDGTPVAYLDANEQNLRKVGMAFGYNTPENYLATASDKALARDLADAELHPLAIAELRRRGRFDARTILANLPSKASHNDYFDHQLFYYETLLRSDMSPAEVVAFLRSAHDYFQTGVQPESLIQLISETLYFLRYTGETRTFASYYPEIYELGQLITWDTETTRIGAYDLFVADLAMALPESDRTILKSGMSRVDCRLVSLVRRSLPSTDDVKVTEKMAALDRTVAPDSSSAERRGI